MDNINNINELSNNELLEMYERVSKEQEFEENQADVKKVLLNSFYGSGALETNPFSSGKLTNASVTIAGRCMNKMTGVSINNWINLTLGKESNLDISDIIQADTDSVTGDSIIIVNGKPIKISDYFDSNNLEDDRAGKEIIKITKGTTPSFNTSKETIEDKNIKYVMRHKTKKKLFKISHNDKEIIVTEDHSIIIKRDGVYRDIKPKDILNGDIIIVRILGGFYETKEFTIEEIGEFDDYVYDIEVEDNHNFFANDILVHNSNYLSLDRLIPTNIPTEEALPKVQKIVSDFIEPNIVRNIKGYCELFNVRDPQVLAAENEVIAKGFVSVASKRYYTRVLVKDNTVLGKPKIKVTGISLKGKSTPELAKVKLEPILDIILDKDENTLKQYIKDTQVAFYEAPISEIARKVKVNSLDYSRVEDKFKKYDGAKFLTAPINSHASLIYNEYITKNNLQAQFNPIEASDSISYIYLNEPNNFGSKSVAFKDNKFTDIIPSRYVDRLTHFEKDFKSKIRIITDAIKWNIDTTTGSLDDW